MTSEKEVIEALFQSLISSYNYNRTDRHIMSMLIELRGRLNDTIPPYMWSDDCDILYGVLVLNFGDYGTSPRSGWFDEKLKSHLIDIVNNKIDYYTFILNMQGEE